MSVGNANGQLLAVPNGSSYRLLRFVERTEYDDDGAKQVKNEIQFLSAEDLTLTRGQIRNSVFLPHTMPAPPDALQAKWSERIGPQHVGHVVAVPTMDRNGLTYGLVRIVSAEPVLERGARSTSYTVESADGQALMKDVSQRYWHQALVVPFELTHDEAMWLKNPLRMAHAFELDPVEREIQAIVQDDNGIDI